MKLSIITMVTISFLLSSLVQAYECHLPPEWRELCADLQIRISQTEQKMKLKESDVQSLERHLQNLHYNFLYLSQLQFKMPKTTIELLIATYQRGVDTNEADKMAQYLLNQVDIYQFKNLSAFDTNTSHIIGREWHEIGYSGENMTWETQKEKYAPYGVSHFKSLECLQKFFPVESKLPYFNKMYGPAPL